MLEQLIEATQRKVNAAMPQHTAVSLGLTAKDMFDY